MEPEGSTISRQVAEEHQMALIGRLLAGIVHEINTPIGSIFSNNEVLLHSLDLLRGLVADAGPEALRKATALIETCHSLAAVDKIACERIASVIVGLKTFARADACQRREADLNENLRNTLKLTQGEFRRRIAVETDFGDLPQVRCYPQLLNQVFLNLLVNAGQAIEGTGTITLRTRAEGENVYIAISDTGRGIRPEDRARIFSAGFTTKPVGVGTGLGLWISKQIVEEKHGGSIAFEGEPGVGTTFHVRIPIVHGE